MNYVLNLFILFIGASFGSFISMLSYRLPKGETIFFKSSYCPKCKKPIGILSLIPIFSWIFQGGKCKKCHKKISIRYPLIELITAVLFLFIYKKWGLKWNTIIFSFLAVALLTAIITDLEQQIIPDSLQVFMAVLAFAYIILNNLDFSSRLISALFYFLIIYFLSWAVSKIKNTEALGGADIKLVTISGLFLGVDEFTKSGFVAGANEFACFFMTAGFIGLVIAFFWKRITGKERFPFGPALAIALFLCLNFGYPSSIIRSIIKYQLSYNVF